MGRGEEISAPIALFMCIISVSVLIAGIITGHSSECDLWTTVVILMAFPAGYGARIALNEVNK